MPMWSVLHRVLTLSHRQRSSMEQELSTEDLDALPPGEVVEDDHADSWEKTADGVWSWNNGAKRYSAERLVDKYGPITRLS